jgi:hypothetical protein
VNRDGVDVSAEETTPPVFGPGTLGMALVAEADGQGHIEFDSGRPIWRPGATRFPVVVEVTP